MWWLSSCVSPTFPFFNLGVYKLKRLRFPKYKVYLYIDIKFHVYSIFNWDYSEILKRLMFLVVSWIIVKEPSGSLHTPLGTICFHHIDQPCAITLKCHLESFYLIRNVKPNALSLFTFIWLCLLICDSSTSSWDVLPCNRPAPIQRSFASVSYSKPWFWRLKVRFLNTSLL